MTDTEINIALAKAIGWAEKDIDRFHQYRSGAIVCGGRYFDYRDPAVIWPIAKHYKVFPQVNAHGLWAVDWYGPTADTPEKAVALVVIGGAA